MKTRRAVSVGRAISFGLLTLCLQPQIHAQEQAISIEAVRAALAEIQPIEIGAVPEFGTFYMLKDYEEFGDAPPYPFNPWPRSPVYAFGGDGVFLVDNTVRSTGRQQLGMVFSMDGEIEPPPEESGETNPPAIA